MTNEEFNQVVEHQIELLKNYSVTSYSDDVYGRYFIIDYQVILSIIKEVESNIMINPSYLDEVFTPLIDKLINIMAFLMVESDINDLKKGIFSDIRSTLNKKGQEYSGEIDRLQMFNLPSSTFLTLRASASSLPDYIRSPFHSCLGMAMKHILSCVDLMDKFNTGKVLNIEMMINEKFIDHINYLLLLKALFVAHSKNLYKQLKGWYNEA